MLWIFAMAFAETASLPDGLAIGLSGTVGGTTGGLESGAGVRLRLGNTLAIEPAVEVETATGTEGSDVGEPVEISQPGVAIGGVARVRVTTIRGADLALLAGGSWERDQSVSVYTSEEYRRISEYTYTDKVLLAGLGVERPVTSWLSIGADLRTGVYAWHLDEGHSYEVLTDPESNHEVEEETEVRRTQGVPFAPSVRLAATIYL